MRRIGARHRRLAPAEGALDSPRSSHLNEGHAACAVLERAVTFKDDTGISFHAALAATQPREPFYHAYRRGGGLRIDFQWISCGPTSNGMALSEWASLSIS